MTFDRLVGADSSTGELPSRVEDRIAAYYRSGVSITQFGADPDDTGTHQAALEAAVAARSVVKDHIRIPAGTWRFSDLPINEHIKIVGEGQKATVIERVTDEPIITATGDAYTGSGDFFPTFFAMSFQDLSFKDNATGTPATPLIDLNGVSNAAFRWCQFESYTGAPLINFSQVFDSRFTDCKFDGGGSYDTGTEATVGALQLFAGVGTDDDGTTYRQTKDLQFVNCWWEQYEGPAIKADRPGGYTTTKVEMLQFSNCKFESRVAEGPHLQLPANHVQFGGTCYFHYENTAGPVLDFASDDGASSGRTISGSIVTYRIPGGVKPSCIVNVPSGSSYVNLDIHVAEAQDSDENVVTLGDPTDRTNQFRITALYPLINSVNVRGHIWRGANGQTLFVDSNSDLRLTKTGMPSADADGTLFGGNERKMRPTGLSVKRETFSRLTFVQSQSALTTQRMTLAAIALEKGDVVTNIGFVSGSTPAGTPTNQWFTLYDSSGNLLGVTADDTTTAWAASTRKFLALSSPYAVTASGIYYIGCMVKATTPPTLLGFNSNAVLTDMAPKLCTLDSTTGLTNPASAPSTWGTQTAQSFMLYGQVS